MKVYVADGFLHKITKSRARLIQRSGAELLKLMPHAIAILAKYQLVSE